MKQTNTNIKEREFDKKFSPSKSFWKVVKFELTNSWKFTLFFGLIWLMVLILFVPLMINVKPTINGYPGFKVSDYAPSISGVNFEADNGANTIGLGTMASFWIYSGVAVAYFSIYSVILINKSINSQMNNGQINMWMSMPLTRREIMNGKVATIIFNQLIVWFPVFVVTLIMGACVHHTSSEMGNLFFYGIEYIIFMIALTTIFTMVYIALVNHTVIANVLASIFIVYVLVTWVLSMLYTDMNMQNLAFAKYISPSNLILNVLAIENGDNPIYSNGVGGKGVDFPKEGATKPWEKVTVGVYAYKSYSVGLAVFFPILGIAVSILCFWGTTEVFVKRSSGNTRKERKMNNSSKDDSESIETGYVAPNSKDLSVKFHKKNEFGKVIRYELLNYWKYILFFGIAWLLVTAILVPVMSGFGPEEFGPFKKADYMPSIANISLAISKKGENIGNSSEVVNGIGDVMTWIFFVGPAAVFFSAFAIVLINKSINTQVKNGEMTTWLSMPLTRRKIMSGKIATILISQLIVFVPSFIIILIIGGVSHHTSEEFWNLFLYGIQFILFIFALSMLYSLISIALVEKTTIAIMTNSIIATYILVVYIMTMIYQQGNVQSLKFAQYITPMSFVINTLQYNEDGQKTLMAKLSENGWHLTEYKLEHVSYSVPLVIAFPILDLALTAGFAIGTIEIFNKKDLSI
ncbi:ABC transporter permease subunit [Mesoplasma lactucae]|uniref:Uncharacterized protein n=1 Tax=Mesoplasma lactucae ATCC 49193 TaxID=81460 RepID=A0A291IS83_9MOLU|nr:ABC transporter permease subunit [Mesoplasma lactucae]ATG97732.1 hypothetical protein CP520_03280 [Mesoplasma lactucae ATCC 49193]ATZ20491.1 hypothetical protein MLACT_v1c06700 [Mesoplasma lactucae ATCC 49193]MCL8216662.1 hypothetical protein [Mesoplasma lactucae ATCC 49193]